MFARTDKYADRLVIGFAVALSFHALLFLLLQFVFRFNLFEKNEYPETIYISLENTTARSADTGTDDASATETDVASKGADDGTIVKTRDTSGESQTTKKTTTVQEQKNTVKSTSGSTTNKTTDTSTKASDSGSVVADSVPVKGEDVAQPTPGKSALDQGGLAGLDSAIAGGSDSGTSSGGSSSGKDGGTSTGSTGKQGASGTGSSVSGDITWGDRNTRAALTTAKPIIPGWVAEQGLRLQATLSFVLTPDGFITNIKVKNSSGYSDVDNALVNALRQYTFPSRKDTKTITGEIPFRIGY